MIERGGMPFGKDLQTRRLLGVALLAGAALAWSGSALAVGPVAAGPAGEQVCSERALAEIRQHSAAAERATLAGKLDAAIEELTLAYRLCLNPGLLYNRAVVLERAGDLARADLTYRHFLQVGHGYPNWLPRARQALERLEASLGPSHGKVTVTTVPETVELRVADWEPETLQTPQQLWLVPGRLDLDFAHDGFCPERRSITPAVGETTALEVKLRAATEGLIDVDAPLGVQVLADGLAIGSAPLRGYSLPIGQHTIALRDLQFLPWEGKVDIQPCAVAKVVPELREVKTSTKSTPLAGTVVAQPPRAHRPTWATATAAGMGALALGAGVGAAALWIERQSLNDDADGLVDKYRDLNDGQHPEYAARYQQAQRDIRDKRDEADGLEPWAWGATGASVALLAGAVVLLLVEDPTATAKGPGAAGGSGGDAGVEWSCSVIPVGPGDGAGVALGCGF